MTYLTQRILQNRILRSQLLRLASTALVLIALQSTFTRNSLAQTNTFPSTGNVGIGTTSPKAKLDIKQPEDTFLGGIHLRRSTTNDTWAIVTGNDNNLYVGYATHASGADAYTDFTVIPLVLTTTNRVGIGTWNPGYKLDVAGVISSSTGGFRFPDGTVQTTAASGGGGGGGGTITGVTAGTGLTGGGTTGTVALTNNDKGSDQFIFKNVANLAGTTQFSAASNNDAVRFAGTGGTTVSFDTGTKKITVDSSGITSSQWTTSGGNINYASGNVGIGITPTEKLHVAGNGIVTGNLTVGTINAKYQDVAEWVPATKALPAGTVVTLDPTKSNHVEASSKAYDTRVAGVISEQPGITLGERADNKVLVATTGRVRLKVDASSGPIQVGDLLVTSDIPGMAMKSQPVNLGGIHLHRPGTLIGKALEPLTKGRGEILVLLSLQ